MPAQAADRLGVLEEDARARARRRLLTCKTCVAEKAEAERAAAAAKRAAKAKEEESIFDAAGAGGGAGASAEGAAAAEPELHECAKCKEQLPAAAFNRTQGPSWMRSPLSDAEQTDGQLATDAIKRLASFSAAGIGKPGAAAFKRVLRTLPMAGFWDFCWILRYRDYFSVYYWK